MKIKEVKEIPIITTKNTIYSINTNKINQYTHGLHKYPAKFIPQIPRWAITKYTKKGDTVIDPFMGCGTTLLESKILERNSIGLEISDLAKLITKAKFYKIKKSDVEINNKNLINKIKNTLFNKSLFYPVTIDTKKWFKKKTLKELSIINHCINNIKDKNYKNFCLIIFSSIIRRVSNAESQSQKVYISSRFPKKYINAIDLFEKELKKYSKLSLELREKTEKDKSYFKIIRRDATSIKKEKNSITLAVTSPPYINAINYINIHKLEYAWLNIGCNKKIEEMSKRQIGSNQVLSKDYNNRIFIEIKEIDDIGKKLFEKNKQLSYIVSKFFIDMEKNIKEVYRVLKPGGIYCLVVGNNVIKNIKIPNDKIITKIAEKNNFKKIESFSYLIKNRVLRIPRNGNGGDIKIDHVLVFKK